jgi:hypothetical protein
MVEKQEEVEMSGTIQPFTWSELGYRRLGPAAALTAGGSSLLEMFHKIGGYQLERPDWIRHPARIRNRQFRTAEIVRRIEHT